MSAAAPSSSRPIRVGINGIGRMGRLSLRAALTQFPSSTLLQFVHINDIAGDATQWAHLLTYDSVHGKWPIPISVSEKKDLIVIGKEGEHQHRITVSKYASPDLVPWRSLGVDMVFECSGAFVQKAELESLYSGRAESPLKVLVSAPVKGMTNVVFGVNQSEVQADSRFVTAASCTTNCLAPIVGVIHRSLGIKHGCITTVHNLTNTQVIVDVPLEDTKDVRRNRAGGLSLIPTSTGSATAIALIFPELQGKLNGLAIRCPLLNSSITDCVFEVNRPTTTAEVNALLTAASQSGPLLDILGVETKGLVSTDYVNDSRSAIVDALSTMVIDGTMVKILAFYDNEFGYCCRMIDIAHLMAKFMQ